MFEIKGKVNTAVCYAKIVEEEAIGQILRMYKDYKKHLSLDKALSVEEWKTEKAYVLCPGNVETSDGVTYLPWYMVLFLRPAQLPKEMKYEIDLSGLIK